MSQMAKQRGKRSRQGGTIRSTTIIISAKLDLHNRQFREAYIHSHLWE